MKKNVFTVAVLLAGILLSCEQKEVIENQNVEETESRSNIEGILSFKNYDEFSSTLSQVIRMTDEERIRWEKSKGFESFGTVCDKFYDSIEPENFSNMDEIKSFAENHKSRIQLIQDADGEISCVTQEYDNPERYLINEARMYIIADKAYKVFPDKKKVSCGITDMGELANVKELSQINKEKHAICEMPERLKVGASSNSSVEYIERTDKLSIGNKNYKTVVRVEAVTLINNSVGLPGKISYYIYFQIQNQHQFIAWFGKTARTQYAPFEYVITNSYENFNGIYRNSYWLYDSFTEDKKTIERNIMPWHVPVNSYTASILSFQGMVHSTFERGDKTAMTTVNLKYPQ